MKRLRIVLRYDEVSSLLIYITPSVILLLLSNIYPYLIIGYLLYMYMLYRQSRILFWYSLFLSLMCLGIYFISFLIFKYYKTTSTLCGYIADKSDSYLIVRSGLHFIKVYCKNPDEYMIGRKITAKVCEYVSNGERNVPSSFSYYRYKLSRNIIAEYQATTIDYKRNSFSIYLIKGYIVKHIETSYSETSIMYLERLILGMSSFDSITNGYAQSTGIIHLFCISGLHVSLFSESLKRILKKLDCPEEAIVISILSTLTLYRIITLSQTSISRAITMIIINEILSYKHRRISKTDCLAISFIISIISNPFACLESGFYLTYLSTLVIYLSDEKSYVRMSLMVMAFTTPILLYSNNGISLFMILYSLVFSLFFSEIFIPFTYIVLFIKDLDFMYNILTTSLNDILESIGNTNVIVEISIPNIYVLLSVYVLMFLLASNFEDKRKRTIFSLSILSVLSIGILFSRMSILPVVEMIDVGQGDSFLVRTGFKNILIDTGVKDKYSTTINYLKSRNIHTLTAMFITHFDSDHSGEMDDIKEAINVRNTYTRLDGYVFRYGSITFYTYSMESSDENESSMVIYMVLGSRTFLFTGDIEKEGEKYILSKLEGKVDFLKVAHHGSKTSSTYQFIKEFSPKVSLISVGLNNSYGHPSDQTIKRLNGVSSRIYRSDIDGTVSITILYKIAIIKTYRNDRILLFTYFKHLGLIID